MSPEAKPNQEQEKNPQILREETTVPKRIRVDTARISTKRLIRGLRDLGVEVLTGYFNVYDAPPIKRGYFAENHEIAITFAKFNVDIPVGNGYGFGELIVDKSFDSANQSALIFDANLRFNNQPVRMHTVYTLRDKYNHELNLVMPVTISANREALLESLPPDFTTAALSYDFVHNPQYRDRLSAVAQKRIPVQIVNGGRVTGKVTPAGIDTQIQLNLQNPDPKNHLRCYEVEIFEGENKNVPQTTDVASEVIWQPKENHFCMVGGESYPLIPVKLNEISKLKMVINYRGDSLKVATDLLGDLPLSIDGTNQWYATREIPGGSLQLLFKPEWGESNAALVFNKVSPKRIFPKEIHGALMQMCVLRKSVTERLAA